MSADNNQIRKQNSQQHVPMEFTTYATALGLACQQTLRFTGSVTILHVKAFKQSNVWLDNQNQILVYFKGFF